MRFESAFVLVACMLVIIYAAPSILKFINKKKKKIPLSVNFHFTRKCNYECGFCFHTAKTSDIPSIPDAKKALGKLAKSGMKKINFAGGEPFLYPKYLAELMDFCKNELKLESVSIVSNGSKIKRDWLESNKGNLDILAVSCDSFQEKTNIKIGRGTGRHVNSLREIAKWCRELDIMFKLNTVVNAFNWQEDMNEEITNLAPFRWKCFQVLVLQNENGGSGTLRDASKFVVTKEQFESFIKRHRGQKSIVPEPNDLMKNSYLILDEHLCFLNCTNDDKKPSESLLNVDVDTALRQAGWDEEAFYKRSGVYHWSRDRLSNNSCGGMGDSKKFDW